MHSLNKRILQYAVSLQVIDSNPAREITVPRRIEREKKKVEYFPDDELRKFLGYLDSLDNSFKNYFDTVLYKLLLATGLRIGEALALEWSDIDLQEATISVAKTLNRYRETNSPKTKASNRVLDLDKKTVLMLRLYKARQMENGRENGTTYTKVFSNSFDQYASVETLRNRLKSQADCPVLGFHAFRHTHASILLNAGLGYKEIQTRLGHSKVSMTIDTYSHLSKENEKKTALVFEKALETVKSS